MTSFEYLEEGQRWDNTVEKLKKQHEEILSEREALLAGRPIPVAKIDIRDSLRQSHTAESRNKRILEDLRVTKDKMRRNTRYHENQILRLKNKAASYWTMVKHLTPEWEKSVKHGTKSKH